ncbi:hypothetical protein Nepgr_027288 [Nepenthes gracilis]|uniref:Uncharacterized protein n=1 Tax=Nepenthes gracilis TaxID=150966 RepID=A0AAD3T8B9_NEPGR|nr:hypothetical protein Nepgr_027288 [Nepenthes gracilis]
MVREPLAGAIEASSEMKNYGRISSLTRHWRASHIPTTWPSKAAASMTPRPVRNSEVKSGERAVLSVNPGSAFSTVSGHLPRRGFTIHIKSHLTTIPGNSIQDSS